MNYKKAYTRINKVDIKKDIETLISKIEKTVIEDIKDLLILFLENSNTK